MVSPEDFYSEDGIKRILAECRERLQLRAEGKLPEVEQDYQSYLRSSLWRRIKRRVLKRDQRVCGCCGGEGKVVHHRSYAPEVMEGKADDMLATVCAGCHAIMHFDENGAKRSAEETERIFLGGQRQTEIPTPRIDLRRRSQGKPAEWPRMTAVQRKLWEEAKQRMLCERHIAKGHMEYQPILDSLNDPQGSRLARVERVFKVPRIGG